VPTVVDGAVGDRDVPALSALNETLRDDYVADCAKGVDRWNRALAQVGAELRLPHIAFNRRVGAFADHHVSPDGRIVDDDTWLANRATWLPTGGDEHFVRSLMRPVAEPGRMAGWIAPPATGVNGKPVEFEYVRVP
jgi:benzoyl-CoA 2,3-dioxygenase component B